MKNISNKFYQGADNHNNCLVILVSIALKLEKQLVQLFQYMSILALCGNRRQETVSMSKYSLK